jgi:hypothetical protein
MTAAAAAAAVALFVLWPFVAELVELERCWPELPIPDNGGNEEKKSIRWIQGSKRIGFLKILSSYFWDLSIF